MAFILKSQIDTDGFIKRFRTASEAGINKINFIPTDVDGCKLWLNANAITGKSDGDALSVWADQSGEGNDVSQATSSYQPLYKTNIINGLPVVQFDATDDSFDSKDWGALSSLYIFAVVQFSDTGIIRGICGVDGTDAGWHFQKLDTDVMSWYLYGPGAGVTGVTALSINTPYCISACYDGVNATLRINGVEDASVAISGDILAGIINIGRAYSTARTLNGDLADLLFYPGVLLDSDDIANVENYLMNKYDIS